VVYFSHKEINYSFNNVNLNISLAVNTVSYRNHTIHQRSNQDFYKAMGLKNGKNLTSF